MNKEAETAATTATTTETATTVDITTTDNVVESTAAQKVASSQEGQECETATASANEQNAKATAQECGTAMTLYVSNLSGRKGNVSYPYEAKITSLEDLKKAVQYDHVSAKYKSKKKNGQVIKGYRSKKGFISSNCLPMDCDNSNPNPMKADLTEADWKKPEDVRAAFPNVPFYVVYSRNHMKVKDGKAARPKFHVYFPMRQAISNIGKYEALKRVALNHFPAFDGNAIDGARFFFGVDDPKAEYFAGDVFIDDFLASDLAAADFKIPKAIPTGDRNNSLFELALKALKRFGEDLAFDKFVEASNKCEEPLPTSELKTIWESASNYYHRKIESSKDYVSPEAFNKALLEARKSTTGGSVDGNNDSDWGDGEERDKKLTTRDVEEALNAMGIKIRLNVITGKVLIKGMPKKHSGSNAANVLPILIRNYFADYRNLTVSRQFIEDSLVEIEDANRYNPIEEMLLKTKNDGKDRIKVLCDVLHISPSTSPQEVIYFKKWLHQCIALALNNDIAVTDDAAHSTPSASKKTDTEESNAGSNSTGAGGNNDGHDNNSGSDAADEWWEEDWETDWDDEDSEPYGADGVLVIQAPQGKGKTLFCRKLAMRAEWFAEGISIDTDNKDSIMRATGKWIAELGELDATLKRDQSSLKAFITSAVDTYRQPYASVAVDRPRRTSFCATVNPAEFINDETGSRRFWVIHPETIDVERLKSLSKRWFRQMWRQVYDELYLPDPQGFRLTDEERAILEHENFQHSKPLPGEIEILDKYKWDAPEKDWEWKKTSEVLLDICVGRSVSPSQIGKTLTKLMAHDKRIEFKKPGNVRMYKLPPTIADEVFK